ncbi:MATE family efflux transporter [Brachyspira pilosicoli]|uniref:MATE family efflux transporter n=1 Tax=Brachyspira pilosicoli TaxID=52584 RepID=UPI001CA4A4A6|nr:MATE family efflux transporter [Brachyspira pilosicoli]MBW5400271.1 MATE family efflux transporter [Brachyspira pilosicoli]
MELNNKTLIENSSIKLFFKFAIPSILGMIMGSAAVFVDGFFVAHFISANAFTAINIVWPITALSFGIYVMLTIGSIALAGKCIGENNIRRANLIFTQTLIVVLTIATLPLIIAYIFRTNLLPLFGAHGEIYQLSLDYIEGVLFATFFWGIAYVLSQFVRLNGSPKFASLMFIISSIANMILDPIFIVVFKLGISGAAWATAISQMIAFIMGLLYFFKPNCKLKIIKVYGGWIYILKASFNGFSEFLSNLSSGLIPWLFNITAYNISGNNGILVYSVANYAIMFFIMLAYSIGEALEPLVSVSYGAKNKNRMKDFLKISIFLISIISILISIVLLINPSSLVKMLLQDVDVKTFEEANFFVRASIPTFIGVGINIIMSAYYTSVQKAGASAIVAALRSTILPIALVLTLPNIIGFLGLILVLPISEIATLIVSVMLYKNRKPDILIS